MSFDMWSQLKEADLFLPLLFIPHLICYYLVKEEFSNTNYDKKGKKYLDKATAIQRAAIWYGLWYGFFGWCLVFVLDLLIFLLSVISNI